MKKIYIICLLLATTVVAESQVTVGAKINYVHGMNGNGHSLVRLRKHMDGWQKIDQIVKTEFHAPVTYDSPLGIRSSAHEVHEEIRGTDLNYFTTDRRILIAHSLGGLVSRQWYNNYKASTGGRQAYNGIITLATPHNGTKIAETLSTPEGRAKFDEHMRSALNSVTEGAKKDAVNTIANLLDNFWLKLVGDIASLSVSLEKMVNKMFGNVIEGVINRIDTNEYIVDKVAGSEKILQDLAYGSTVIAEINNRDINNTDGEYDLSVRKIALWGNESSPQVFKMMGASFHIDELGNTNYALQTNCDLKLITKLNTISAFCKSRSQYNIDKMAWWMIPSQINAYKEKAAAWTRSADYIDTKFHKLFLQELGLQYAKYTPRTETVTDCNVFGICIPRTVTYYDSQIVNANNDGLVTEASQKYFAGAFKAQLDGINHEEMKMHQDVGDAMHAIFYGENFREIYKYSQNHYDFYHLYEYTD